MYLCLAMPFGILLGVVTPPMQVPDEGAHFMRAFQVSEGIWIPRRISTIGEHHRQVSVTGGDMPLSLIRFYKVYEVLILHPDVRVDPWEGLTGDSRYDIDLQKRLFFGFSGAALYSPLVYAPQALGIRLARPFSRSALHSFYAARLANLTVSIFLIFLAIRVTPGFAWMFVFLAMSPMTLFEMASVSADAFVTSICFLFIALVLRCAYGPESHVTYGMWIGVLVLAGCIGLIKQVYAPLILLYFLIPRARVGSRLRYWSIFACHCCVMGAAGILWGLAVGRTVSAVKPYVDPYAQLSHIVLYPDRFVYAMLRCAVDPNHGVAKGAAFAPLFARIEQYIGYLGHGDTPLPISLVWLHGTIIVCLASFNWGIDGPTVGRWAKIVCISVCVVVVILTVVAAYLMWTAVGAETIDGIQGRYFIPIGPVLCLVLCGLLDGFPRAMSFVNRTLPFICIIYVPFSLNVTLWILYCRYYMK